MNFPPDSVSKFSLARIFGQKWTASEFLGKNGRFRDSDGLKFFGKIPDIGKNLKKFSKNWKNSKTMVRFGIFWARLPDLAKICVVKFP